MPPILQTITDAIINSTPDKKDISLVTGNSGRILFLATSYLKTGDESCHEKINELLDQNFMILEKEPLSTSFRNGLAGFGWLLQHLGEHRLLDQEELTDILRQFDRIITSDIHQKTDTLQDLTGFNARIFQTSHYLFPRLKKSGDIKPVLEAVVNHLDHIIPDYMNVGNTPFQSPETAPAILFLCTCVRSGIQEQKSKALITFILANIVISLSLFTDKNTFFPLRGSSDGRTVSLDLNMAHALWEAAKICKNTYWRRLACIILKYNTYNKDKNHDFFYQSGIARDHWGIAYRYRYFYQETAFRLLEKNSNFWCDAKLLPSLNSKYGVPGLENGISGIGLALIPPMDQSLIGII
ncbi:lanthionine synthetase LanC family protein [Sinomicrobium oceani]|uniref:lanthionine synthetase LanC family protein n=1 Tax=Sinomicrobium oceani TaxID=1150368 RepID=UPI00227B1FA9|nr:lanthionine synthetase LanC family protein [Sinomicrobium oceani]